MLPLHIRDCLAQADSRSEAIPFRLWPLSTTKDVTLTRNSLKGTSAVSAKQCSLVDATSTNPTIDSAVAEALEAESPFVVATTMRKEVFAASAFCEPLVQSMDGKSVVYIET